LYGSNRLRASKAFSFRPNRFVGRYIEKRVHQRGSSIA
jgi:hypothetical protein